MAAENVPMINGQLFVWANCSFNILGRTVAGITEVMYEETEPIKPAMGAGKYPVGYYTETVQFKASVTLHLEEVIALQKLVASRRLQDLPLFDFPVTYKRELGSQSVTDILRNVKFTVNKREFKQADGNMLVQIELFISHIDWDV